MNTDAYANRGLAYEKRGQHDKAILEFTKAIEIDPTWAEPYVYRGIVYLEDKYQYVGSPI
jgi:tetratricopeptide (TPR) repeat protein